MKVVTKQYSDETGCVHEMLISTVGPFNSWREYYDSKLKPELRDIFYPQPPKFEIKGGIGPSVKIVDRSLGDWTHLNDGLRSYYIGKIGRIVKVDPFTYGICDDKKALKTMAERQRYYGINGHSYTVRFPTSWDPSHEGPVEITFVEEHLEAV